MAKPPKKPKVSGRPTKRQLVEFINDREGAVSRREIAQAFKIKGADRTWLRETLRALTDDGLINRQRGRRVAAPGRLPSVTVIEVAFLNEDGEAYCRPVAEHDADAPATIRLVHGRGAGPAPGVGDRILARLRRTESNEYEARVIRLLAAAPRQILALYVKEGGKDVLRPIDRKMRSDYEVVSPLLKDIRVGDYVAAVPVAASGRPGGKQAKIVERLGRLDDPRVIPQIAARSREIPIEFAADVLRETDKLTPPALGNRTDLRQVPLVTIDGADARDFDDAVWAEADTDPKNPDGWHAIVAIADVAWYVRPGSPLDRSARERGNSVYFPNWVIPMLPERLSNDLCSLRPNEDRACLAADLWIDRNGKIKRYEFRRAIMRSAARLTYEQVQKTRDGAPDDAIAPLYRSVIAPLYGAFKALKKARERRGTLDLDLPERNILFDEDGEVAEIVPRQRFDSHRLIEELMIAANCAAAEALQNASQPTVRRLHDAPDAEALESLRESLAAFGIRLAKGGVIRPSMFAGILAQAQESQHAPLIHNLVLRSQTQAYYAPADLGHFGLALRRYCHFTSPIRRYADLIVHRRLIATFDLGEGGDVNDSIEGLRDVGEHISNTERRAASAERDALDRYTTRYLADRIGATFPGRVSGVTRAGLFVQLDETGADGLVPMQALPDDWYNHDQVRHQLVGERTGLTFSMSDPVIVRLTEADQATGRLNFDIVEGGTQGKTRKGRTPARRSKLKRPPSRRKRTR